MWNYTKVDLKVGNKNCDKKIFIDQKLLKFLYNLKTKFEKFIRKKNYIKLLIEKKRHKVCHNTQDTIIDFHTRF
jgi:hypothetical protein